MRLSEIVARLRGRAPSLGDTVLLALPAAVIACHPLANNDLPMHLAIGDWILAEGRIPHLDPFSFNGNGEPWVPHEWLAGVLFSGIQRLGGAAGLVAAAVGLAALVAGAQRATAARLGVTRGAHLLWGIPLWLLAGRRLMLRPHLIALGLPFLLWWLLLAGRGRPRLLWGAPLILLLWANVHASFPLGIAIVAAELLLPATGRAASLTTRAAVLMLCLAALLLTPHGVEHLLLPLRLGADPVFMEAIQEWASPVGGGEHSAAFRHTPVFALSIPWILLTLPALFRRRSRLPLSYRLFALATLVLYLRHQRYLALLALATLPLLPCTGWSPRAVSARALPRLATLLASLLLLYPGYPVTWRSQRPAGGGWSPTLPIEQVRILHREWKTRGPVLCEYEYGGTVAWASRGELQPSMDSRNRVYGAEIFREHENALDRDDEERRRLLDLAAAAIIHHPQRDPWRRELAGQLDIDPTWRRIAISPWFLVYVRNR
ncbi:MAG: hypothetical protein ACE5GW_04545 [Planctomycetota bacterium]